MTDLLPLLQQGNAWLFIPTAVMLGALHGLEPGHSKTMMAAFIVAIRGTLTQAVLLGLSATLSHTVIVWVVAIAALTLGKNWDFEATEASFQIVSAVLIVGIAAWMLWRTWRQHHAVVHHHSGDRQTIDTGHGIVQLEIFEENVPPRFRLHNNTGDHFWSAEQVHLETKRPDGTRQTFTFSAHDNFIESEQEIPEPHAFTARLQLGDHQHSHTFDVEFSEHSHHHTETETIAEHEDAHQRAHANDIRRRFADREATTGQIILFGLSGGLVPCPASITILLLCLQLKKVFLGVSLVLCFSIGLAITMVAAGAIAALSVQHASKHWKGFDTIARRAPYLSGGLIALIGLYIGYHGIAAL